jgi:hypothetical protein
MTSVELLDRLLDDLKKVRLVCRESGLEHLPDVAVRYLAVNHDAIFFFVDHVYSAMGSGGRLVLMQQHADLDYSVVSNSFRPLALSAIETAVEWIRAARDDIRALFRVSEDDLQMLLRALEYARYSPCDSPTFEVRLSPIQHFGLDRPAGNFLSISEEEWRVVPWHISDLIYGEKRAEAFERCRTLGLDLEKPEISFLRAGSRTELADWGDVIVDLIQCRLECDLAVVMLRAAAKRARYLNVIVGRVNSEFGSLIDALRHALYGLGPQPPTMGHEFAVESELEPLLTRFNKVVAGVGDVQPRPAIYETVARLDSASGKTQEVTMGDKYEVHGQAGAVGPHAHAHDINFHQIWNQAGLDLEKLGQELSRLRTAMLAEAGTAEHYAAIGAVASAEIEAQNGDGPRVLQLLSKAGKWALDTASKIGADLIVAALKKASDL